MGEPQPDRSGEKAIHVIPDLSALPLEEVFSNDDSALAHAVRRVVDEMHEKSEPYAAHSSCS